MAKYDFTNTTSTDYTNKVTDWSVTSKELDGVLDQEETTYTNDRWAEFWGYFNSVPDLKSAITLMAIWNVGKGYTTSDSRTKVILDNIDGWGKDTFLDILFNMEIMSRVGGDAFAEIIRNEKGTLINLKPLDPHSMQIVVDEKGRIKRYEQISKVKEGTGKNFKTYQPEDILHFCHNRLGDQIHGISDIIALEDVIKADMENFYDMKTIMKRQARPLIMFKLGTDDTTKISQFATKVANARNLSEDLMIPDDENAVSYEVVQINISSLIMNWRDDIRNKFYRTIGLPQIVPGGGGQSTESESKVIYFAFEQIVEKHQRHIEQQLWKQLGIKLNLIPPSSLINDLQNDSAKDGPQANVGIQPSDTQVGKGR